MNGLHEQAGAGSVNCISWSCRSRRRPGRRRRRARRRRRSRDRSGSARRTCARSRASPCCTAPFPPVLRAGVVVLDHVREAVVVGVALVVGQVAVAGEVERLQRGVPGGQHLAAGVLRAVAVGAELTAGAHRAADVLPQLVLLPGQQAVAVEVAVDVGRVERVRPRLLAGVRVRAASSGRARTGTPSRPLRPSVSVSSAARVGADALLEAVAQRVLVLVAARVRRARRARHCS